MGLYMRAVLDEWHEPSFGELAEHVAGHSDFRARDVDGRGWREFELLGPDGTTVLAADLTVGKDTREELDELDEFVDDLDGDAAIREAVRAHLRDATAVVGMQVLPSVHEASVAAANAVIDYLEQRPGVLVQVDTVGWYDGLELILRETDAEG